MGVVICDIPVPYQNHPIDTDMCPERVWNPTAKQRAVIACYASPPWPAYNEAARLQGVAVQTAKGWKRSPAFAEMLEAERKQGLELYLRELDASLAGLGQKAIDVLMQGMDGPDPRVQSQNARWVLEQLRGKATPRHEEEADDTGDRVAQMRELLRTPIAVNYPDPSGPDGWQPQDMHALS